ncbi:MAG: MBL fold metallo-hydrolase [Solirubrobacterales bacterium]|nr:MBL fold metallo-hydrolase [Solirubrobacterales bacterium]HMT05831.1 MBL fold metallo-hydrolase [Solirubrobacterales bacterium]
MNFTVLGKSPAWQDVDGACSGYLVTEGDTTVLLDCGNGVFGKLRKYHDYVDIDAIVISHLHADHFADLIPFGFALRFAPRQQPVPIDPWPGTDTPARPKLYGPPGSHQFLSDLDDTWSLGSHFEHAFETHEYDPNEGIEIGPLTIEFREVPHYVRTFAISVTGSGEGRLVYGADCCPNDALIDFAEDAELLVAESTLPRPERTGIRGHLTPAEAGEHAEQARAKQLVLTHISDELEPEWAVAEARSTYSGPVQVAFEGLEIEV